MSFIAGKTMLSPEGIRLLVFSRTQWEACARVCARAFVSTGALSVTRAFCHMNLLRKPFALMLRAHVQSWTQANMPCLHWQTLHSITQFWSGHAPSSFPGHADSRAGNVAQTSYIKNTLNWLCRTSSLLSPCYAFILNVSLPECHAPARMTYYVRGVPGSLSSSGSPLR